MTEECGICKKLYNDNRTLRNEVSRYQSAVRMIKRTMEEVQLFEDSSEHLGTCDVKAIELATLLNALDKAKGNRTKAAALMGIARSTIFEMIKRHNLNSRKGRGAHV